jgi:class 3 adenylate cyclase
VRLTDESAGVEQDGYLLLERQIEAINRFPDANPNPVLRIAGDDRLIYANPASEPILAALGIQLGDALPAQLGEKIRRRASEDPPGRFELEVDDGRRTFAITCVRVADLGVTNLYGQDITAAKVVERFPDLNPNPVLRVDGDGALIYANTASEPIVRALGLSVGSTLPAEFLAQVRAACSGLSGPIEVRGEGRIFAIRPVDIPEFGFTNLYGTDVTAVKAVDKFPDLNPNPVMRVSWEGRLRYANPASEPIRAALGCRIGDQLPAGLFEQVMQSIGSDSPSVIEVTAGDRIYELLVASVFEFESINLYGTDVTAARQVQEANRLNESLLLNILPPSIAQRLREGEGVIADRFDEMTVLFADVVDFTPLSARRSATEVVGLLNSVFSAFDGLVERYALEKIKTVGDAYMVAGGLSPDGPADDAERVADMALEMIEAVDRVGAELGEPLAIRVGLHTGPAVAGVIGIKKFIYDVWGDTVNTASRMESHGVPGRVQVTDTTYRRLRSTHDFEPRGTIDVKGKGSIETYLLVGRRPT